MFGGFSYVIVLSTHSLHKVWTIVLCQEFPQLLFSKASGHTSRQHPLMPLMFQELGKEWGQR